MTKLKRWTMVKKSRMTGSRFKNDLILRNFLLNHFKKNKNAHQDSFEQEIPLASSLRPVYDQIRENLRRKLTLLAEKSKEILHYYEEQLKEQKERIKKKEKVGYWITFSYNLYYFIKLAIKLQERLGAAFTNLESDSRRRRRSIENRVNLLLS